MANPTAAERRSTMPALTYNVAGAGRKQSALQSFGIRKKSEIDIILEGRDEFIHTYTTFDTISGHANFSFDRDTTVDGLHITLHGQSDTWVEKMTAMTPRTGRATARHIFLKIQQPIDSNPFSEGNVAKAGVTYTVPFSFVVPEKILPFVCSHKVASEVVRSQHLFLPPSIGDEMLAGEGSVLMDDLSPNMAKIVYSIRVSLAKANLNNRPREVVQEFKRIRIIPSRLELPPEIIDSGNEQCINYQLRKEKKVRKGLLKLGKPSGTIVAETTQPRSLRLPHTSNTDDRSVSTNTIVNLRFDPTSTDEEPPRLSSVVSKLKAYTFFGAQPFSSHPDPSNYDVWSLMHGQYAASVDLACMNLSAVNWTKHQPEGPFHERVRTGSVATSTSAKATARKMSTSTGNGSNGARSTYTSLGRRASNGSDYSNASFSPSTSITSLSAPTSPVTTNESVNFPKSSIVSPSTRYDQTLPYYTASIVVPITLPTVGVSSTTTTTSLSSSSSPTESSDCTSSTTPTTFTSKSSSAFSRKKGLTTFLPSFHSCLLSRTYTLELALHAANPAPQLNLRIPIQISKDLNPDTSRTNVSTTTANINNTTNTAAATIPMTWYDPFSLNTDEQDTMNDEAIAHALALHQHEDDIPSYTDQMPISQPTPPARAFSEPMLNNAPPPEYYSGFRPNQQRPNIAARNTNSNTSSATTPAQERRSSAAGPWQRRDGSAWTKRLSSVLKT